MKKAMIAVIDLEVIIEGINTEVRQAKVDLEMTIDVEMIRKTSPRMPISLEALTEETEIGIGTEIETIGTRIRGITAVGGIEIVITRIAEDIIETMTRITVEVGEKREARNAATSDSHIVYLLLN